jgi:hypothetical protein
MGTQRRVMVAASITSVALAASVVTAHQLASSSHHRASSNATVGSISERPAAAQASAVQIDPAAHEVFAPPSAAARPTTTLSAGQAWAKWAARLGASNLSIPADMTVRLGALTLPLTADHQLAFGFEGVPQACRGNAIIKNPSSQCVRWIFLDARTGDLIDSTLASIN